jgi:uncharacterized protein (TIGR02271 family)
MENEANRTSTEPRTSQGFSEVNMERVAGYDVYDRNNEHIGSTTAIWMDPQEQPAFIGVKTTWLFGKTHVVPAYGAEVNHREERVRLAYAGDIVKDAPSYDPDSELDQAKQRKVFAYYRDKGTFLPEGMESRGEEAGRRETEPTRAETGTETVIPLSEEEIRVGKRQVETGGVRLRKIVRSEVVQRPVELQHEEVVIERTPGGQASKPGEQVFEGQDIYIPLRREEPVIEKEARVREEIRARKTTGTEQRTVSGEVRKEDVEVEKQRKAA